MTPSVSILFTFQFQLAKYLYCKIATALQALLSIAFAPLRFLHKLLFVPKRAGGSQPISIIFRRIFESKHLKHSLGFNLIILSIFALIYSLPTPAIGGYQGQAVSDATFSQTELSALPVINTDTTFQDPVAGYLSQSYSWYHPALDIAGNEHQHIYPITNGKVVMIEKSRWGYGNNIIIAHGSNIYSRYAHMSAIKVQLNQQVDKNTLLGYVGNTGLSTGPHLHLEVYKDGQAINPLTYIPNQYTPYFADKSADINHDIVTSAAQEAVVLASNNYQPPPISTHSATTTSYQYASTSAYISKEVSAGFVEPQAYTNATQSAYFGSATQSAKLE